MIEIGYFSLCLALVAAGCAIGFSAAGAHRQHLPLIRSGEHAALAYAGLLTISVMVLWHALFTHNFEVQFVAENSNRDMPTLYVISALWGGQNGSLLFWGWILSLFTAATVLFNRHRYRALMPYVVGTLAITGFFFVLLNLFAADPFKKMPFVPADGRGLNPLLQHPLMAIHPPLLYLGMVGMSVPFAFGIAALISRQLDSAWLLAARRWMLIPWTFLGAGLVLGGKWAYVELGWGGYWGWDPVENSSLVPWLAGTAFLHSIMIQERRGMLKVWNMVLVVLTYCLCIFGTFLTRSGIVSSVHAFAQSNVGPFFVVFLGLAILGSALLLLSRLPELRAESRLESFISRETAFLLNNWILLGMLFAVMWGTLFPVISEALTDEKITVGPPFFNQVNVPIGLVLLLLTGAGPLFAWRRTSTESLRRNFAVPVGAALPAAALLLIAGVRDIYALISLSLCVFVVASIALEFHRGAGARQHSTGEPYGQALVRLLSKSRRRYGGYLVHLSMVMLFIGFTGQAFTTDKEFVLHRGETAHVAGYTLQYWDLVQTQDANMSVVAASLELSRLGEFLGTLLPSRNFYQTHEQATTEVSIYSSLREDFYLILVGISDDGSAKFQAYVNPLVTWVWGGGLLFVLASLWAMWPTARERRLAALERASVRQADFLFGPGTAPTHA
ncbi:MAG: heme lyase CcmF/NrfE family subunit [Candidatus Handelsmanbacteria bacterium]|nr:heme lyase CcmF/NrfE family subunit [Candidatus Handelsmanbacteria bacterium]